MLQKHDRNSKIFCGGTVLKTSSKVFREQKRSHVAFRPGQQSKICSIVRDVLQKWQHFDVRNNPLINCFYLWTFT